MNARKPAHRRVQTKLTRDRDLLERLRNWAVIIGVVIAVLVEVFRLSGWLDSRFTRLRNQMTEVESALDERMDELTERMARVEGILQGLRDLLSGGDSAAD